jgi:hypothetical protein
VEYITSCSVWDTIDLCSNGPRNGRLSILCQDFIHVFTRYILEVYEKTIQVKEAAPDFGMSVAVPSVEVRQLSPYSVTLGVAISRNWIPVAVEEKFWAAKEQSAEGHVVSSFHDLIGHKTSEGKWAWLGCLLEYEDYVTIRGDQTKKAGTVGSLQNTYVFLQRFTLSFSRPQHISRYSHKAPKSIDQLGSVFIYDGSRK